MPEPAFGLSRIGQISVNVQDLDRAVAFYRDTLGVPMLFRVPGLAFFDCDGTRLMLGRAETPEFDHRSSVLYFDVEDLGSAFATLTSRGVAFEDEPHKIADLGERELWMAFFRDTEGNSHALMSEIARMRG